MPILRPVRERQRNPVRSETVELPVVFEMLPEPNPAPLPKHKHWLIRLFSRDRRLPKATLEAGN